MKQIQNFINEAIFEKFHLRNIDIVIDEDLRNYIENPHSYSRKHQQTSKYLTKNINKSELIDLIHKCDIQITNAILNNKLSINDEFGIRKHDKKSNECLSIVCVLKYFDKSTLEYDILAKTNNRTDYEFKFKNVKFYCDIESDGRVKVIY